MCIRDSARTGPVALTVNAFSTNSNQDVLFTMPNPVVNSVSPTNGPMGTQVQINGSGFGTTQSSGILSFQGNGTRVAATVLSWSDSVITATVPGTAISGQVSVTNGGVASTSAVYFTVPPPHITSLSPSPVKGGSQITITGTGFHGTPGSVICVDCLLYTSDAADE